MISLEGKVHNVFPHCVQKKIGKVTVCGAKNHSSIGCVEIGEKQVLICDFSRNE